MIIIVCGLFVLLLIMTLLVITVAIISLPRFDGTYYFPHVHAKVEITADNYGVSSITTPSRNDAFFALGYIMARDRFFQMDILRRTVSGRLSEILGKSLIPFDTKQRVLGLRLVAQEVVEHLPSEQRDVIQAFARGVNASMTSMLFPALEYLILRCRPERWSPEDSILVGLYLFQHLTKKAEGCERSMTIMEAALSPEAFAFLASDEDDWPTTLLGGTEGNRPRKSFPMQSLIQICQKFRKQGQREGLSTDPPGDVVLGSNGWVVGHTKTSDGRTILANDIHLPLSVPNVWYRVRLAYEGEEMTGLAVPGLPMIITGSNGHVAWGMTNTGGDVLDLIFLETNPEQPDEYKTPQGWKKFQTREEKIQVKRGKEIHVLVKSTIWGPVLEQSLLGKQVAIHWTALDPKANNLGLIDFDLVRSVQDGIDVCHRFGGPPLNMMLADREGSIGWTVCGKIPIRKGGDGFTCKSWADGSVGWEGYVDPVDMPRVVNPVSAVLVTANQRTVGNLYPYVIGHDFSCGYRAHYLLQKLERMNAVTEQDMLTLQLNVDGVFYDFYRDIALQALADFEEDDLAQEVRAVIEKWNGKVAMDSVGIGILVVFRNILVRDVLEPYIAVCKDLDADFDHEYWSSLETPLRYILRERNPEMLPSPVLYASWNVFLCKKLLKCAQFLKREHKVKDLAELTWGRLNMVKIAHPLSRALPAVLRKLMDMSPVTLPGCVYCVNVATSEVSAISRMVLSPSELQVGILQMSCGQVGHPLSRHYRDQQKNWIKGTPSSFMPGPDLHRIWLLPHK